MTNVQMMDQMFPRTTVTEADKKRVLDGLMSVKEDATAHRKFSDYLRSLFPNAVAVYLFLIFATTSIMVYFLISLFGKMQGLYEKAETRERVSNQAVKVIEDNNATIKQIKDSMFLWHYQAINRGLVNQMKVEDIGRKADSLLKKQ